MHVYTYNNKTIFKLVATYTHNVFEIYILDKIEFLIICFIILYHGTIHRL
jgi:hypothetical protein